MSATTGITAAAPQPPPPVAAAPSGVPAPAPAPSTDQPAVVVSISAGASGAAAQAAPTQLGERDPTAAINALAWTGGANGAAFLATHIDWSDVAAHAGQAAADHDRDQVLGIAIENASHALSYASALGIPVQSTENTAATPDSTQPDAKLTTFTVSDFSFTSAGSIYTVTHGKNGTLLGTKDGQYWQSWQLTDPSASSGAAHADDGASAPLQTLTAVSAQLASAHATSRPGLDVSA
jgi:hypothetical protein